MWNLGQSILGGDEADREDRFFDGDSDGICNLSPLQRMYGFAAALIAGLLLMFLSFIVFSKSIKFALLFTFGNVLAIGRLCYLLLPSKPMGMFQQEHDFVSCTTFLMGPAQQLTMMFDPVRLYATILYLGCVVLALICALLIHSIILTIIAIICEICALVWYSLSYIPFARRMVSDMMVRIFDTEI